MNLDVHPAANRELHRKAEHAALLAYFASTSATPRKQMAAMDRAARKVFIDHGTPRELASFYCGCVTLLVLTRLSPSRHA